MPKKSTIFEIFNINLKVITPLEIRAKKFPRDYKVKLFRVVVPTDKTEYVATNDVYQCSTDATKDESGIRWKIEEISQRTKTDSVY